MKKESPFKKRFPIQTIFSLMVLMTMILSPLSLTSAKATPSSANLNMMTYKESPDLAIQVQQGKLPPLSQRLPDNPAIVQTAESIGQYGGVWHGIEGGWELGVFMTMYEPLIRWKADYSGYEPGLAESYNWSADGKTFTMYLRHNLRWSDGELFTTQDLKFWWEDIARDPNVLEGAGIPYYMYKADHSTPIDVTFPDDVTMVWNSDQPMWIAPYNLAQMGEFAQNMMKPAHYLKQFHPKYTPTATYDLLQQKDNWSANPDFPTPFAWKLTQFDPGVQMVFDRNPYYWKVDSQGNQLPYINQVIYDTQTAQSDHATVVAKLSQGLYDASFRGSDDSRDFATLSANAAAGGYHLQKGWVSGNGANPAWVINQDYTETGDPATDTALVQETRALLRNPVFRRALSVAMDRQDFINKVWNGAGTPKSFTVSAQAYHFATPDGQLMYQKWANAYAQFDPTQANAWLDSIGMNQRDAQDCRELPSGVPFALSINYHSGVSTENDGNLLLKTYLQTVGICSTLNDVSGTPHDATIPGYGNWMLQNYSVGEMDLWTLPGWVFPVEGGRYFPFQGQWRASGGNAGWQPAPGSDAANLLALWDAAQLAPTAQDREVILRQAIQYHIDHGPFVLAATDGEQSVPVVIKDNFHNVPEMGILGPWAVASPGNVHPEQFWISDKVFSPIFARAIPNQGRSDISNDVYIHGSQFSSGIAVTLGTTPLRAELMNANLLHITIPSGLAAGSYDLTLTNLGAASVTVKNAYTVTDPLTTDLAGYGYEFGVTPASLQIGQTGKLSLIVYQIGGTNTLNSVKVNFYDGDPATSGKLIGQGTVASLAPNSSASTSEVSWTPAQMGNRAIYAVIDPGNQVTEVNEMNNQVNRTVTVNAVALDQTPPVVDTFTINGQATTVYNPNVTMATSAHDPSTPSSGVDSILVVEYQYNLSTAEWIAGQDSGWLPYAQMSAGRSWMLLPEPGMKYLKVWAKDKAGNVSAAPFERFLNYIPPMGNVAEGKSHIYRFTVPAGKMLTAKVTPQGGDPDLYIWNPDNSAACASIEVGTVMEQCSVTVGAAQSSGVYQVEVYGFIQSSYILQVDVSDIPAQGTAGSAHLALIDKVARTVPAVAVTDVPTHPYALPTTTVFYSVYMPATVK